MTPATDLQPGFALRHYFAILRRRWLVIMITTIVVTGGAVAFSEIQAPSYSATAEIVFTPAPTGLPVAPSVESLDPARDVQTQIEVLNSTQVHGQVAHALHTATAPDISASPVNGANAFTITATSANPGRAARIANTYANTYIAFSRNQEVNDLIDAEQAIQNRIDDLQNQINTITDQITNAPASGQTATLGNLGPVRDALVNQETTLKQELDTSQLQAALGTTGAQLGSPATVPATSSGPRPVTNGLSGLAGGAFLGVVLSFLVDYLDDAIESRQDAERAAYGLSSLGVTLSVPARKHAVVLPALSAAASPPAEAYRSLRTTIQFLAAEKALRVVLVTSPGTGEGKSTSLANLAVAFGRSGARVCAVDGDLRDPHLHEFFGCDSQPGLTSVVAGELPLSHAVRALPDARISLLAAGPLPGNPSEVLGSNRTEGVLASLASQYDIVLVDAPPALPVTDAAVLARHVDAVVVVVQARRTKARSLTQAVEVLRRVDATILGVIVNRSPGETGFGYPARHRATKPASTGTTPATTVASSDPQATHAAGHEEMVHQPA